jgi:formimidoylglutamase
MNSVLRPVDAALLARGTDDDPRLGRLVGNVDGDTSVAIIGCADDTGVANSGGRTGAALGSTEIRRWLYKQTIGMDGALEGLALADLGDVLPQGSLEATHEALEAVVAAQLRSGRVVVFLGGGHDLAYATQSAVFGACQGHGAVVNVDTHLDVRPLKDGRIITSGTPFRRLVERFGPRVSPLIALGVQPQHNARAHREWLRARGGRDVSLSELREAPGVTARMASIWNSAVAGSDFATLSLDLDVAAADAAPGTSAPPADGLAPSDLAAICRLAGRHPGTRLLDLVELSPPHDENGKTARLAALCAWSFLAGIAARPS